MRIAIIGAGISGIAFARVLERFGHHCTVFEKNTSPGGIWALAYPGVSLQNSREQYHFCDLPWPVEPDQHPTGRQILDYITAVAMRERIDLRLAHEVVEARPREDGWDVTTAGPDGRDTQPFDYLVVSVGQYAEGKYRPRFTGEDDFEGSILTERDVADLDSFRGRQVAVVGFGKSAVDMAAFAAARQAKVAHVFRTPRWLVPFRVLGMHFTYPFFARATTALMPSWVHPQLPLRMLHRVAPFLVRGFWALVSAYVRRHIRQHAGGLGAAARQRLARVTPSHGLVPDMRSALAMAPRHYYEQVASGRIEPHHAAVESFTPTGLRLADGTEVSADQVILSCGSEAPRFPFLPQALRDLLEADEDGPQLYRHVLHPRIPRLAFAGYNHGFMHIPTAELGALWLCAVLRGDIQLPDEATQAASIARIQAWKREHIHFEPSRSCAVNTRFQQYMDAILLELGLSPYRKMPNVLAEIGARYGASDYAGVIDEYLKSGDRGPRPSLPLDI